jgi:hypothetical protein
MQSSVGDRWVFYAGPVLFASAMLEELGNIFSCEPQHLE